MTAVVLPELTPANGLIFRVTHIRNVPWILENGLHCRNSATRDPNYVPIGNPDLIANRAGRVIPHAPHGTLADYVPFYLTPRSPMLLNIVSGWGVDPVPNQDLVILVSTVQRLLGSGATFLISDRHAYEQPAIFSNDPAVLAGFEWERLRTSNFRDRREDPEGFARYQAEVLVHRHLPVTLLDRIVCYGPAQSDALRAEVDQRRLALSVEVRREYLFA